MGWPTDADIERHRIAQLEKVGVENECPQCGGEGWIDDGSCTCGDDTCCCLETDAPECPLCGGAGFIGITKSRPLSPEGTNA